MLAVDPIDRPDYNPMRAREANPETMQRIAYLGATYRQKLAEARIVREEMEREIRLAKAAGHSFPQLAEAAGEGFSIGVIQRIVDNR